VSAKVRELLMMELLRQAKISQGKAAELLGVDRWALMELIAEEVRGWLAALGRLLLWGWQILSPVSIPKAQQEAISLDSVKDLWYSSLKSKN
jgi:hypothetical protein